MNRLVEQLRILAIFEGFSFLLFALTMPLKYSLGFGLPNQIVGMIHGVLFIAYCLWVILCSIKGKWNLKTTLLGLISSLIPFATFLYDHKILKKIN